MTSKRRRNKRILRDFYRDTTSEGGARHHDPALDLSQKKPPILTDFQGKTTLQKNVLQGGNTAHLARNKFTQKTQVHISFFFFFQVHISKRAVPPSQLIRAALKEAAAESAALGSSVQFFFPVTFSNNTDKGLFLFQKIRL